MKTNLLSLAIISINLNILAAAQAPREFTAHEWGTFTSVQGADGVQIEWNPLVTSELPGFVYDRNRANGKINGPKFPELAGKSSFVTLQRMETPVIYLYSPEEKTVDVSVMFPQGIVTEWYPQLAALSPNNKEDAQLSLQHGIRWAGVRVVPKAVEQTAAGLLPADRSGSHYYAARQTEADLLHVKTAQGSSGSGVETEKFLFYRGVGSFRAPLQAGMGGDEDYVTLNNTGAQPLTDLFILNIHKPSPGAAPLAKFIYVDRLQPAETRTVNLQGDRELMLLEKLRPQIMQRMQQSLAAGGLYGAEAAAMTQTWQDSWFNEEGLRVLYVLPRQWTDQILPLTINPAPKEIVRVMVGRAEMITPTMERQLRNQIVRFGESDEKSRAQVVADTRNLGLGRFAEPALRRVLGKTPTREFSQQGWKLIEALRPASKESKGFAVK